MGFKYIALQTEPEALYHHSAGALLIFIGAWLCWEAMVVSRDAWWRDPTNAARFAQVFRKEHSWVALVENHPATISEMIGDQTKAQGAVAIAICMPACMLSLAGGFMVNQAWPLGETEDPMWAHFANTIRSALMPVGFLMVLFTPIISLDKYEYGETRSGTPWKNVKQRSEMEEQWHMQHHNVHAAGFISAVGFGIAFEAAFLAADLAWYFSGGSELRPWALAARVTWCILAGLRGLAIVLQTTSLVNFVLAMSDSVKLNDPRLLKYRKWMTEYGCLVLGGMVMMYDAASVFVFARHGPRNLGDWPSVLLVVMVLAETLRFTKGFFGFGDVSWSGLGALYDFNKIDFEGLIHYIFSVRCAPPLLLAMKTKTKSELLGIDMAQAGDKDSFTVLWHNLGSGLPKVQVLLVCPGLIESVEAITHDEMSDADLVIYHEDLAKALRQLPSADIMLMPFGRTVYKCGRRMPLCLFPLTDYTGDLKKVREGVPGTKPRLPESCGTVADYCGLLGLSRQGLRINSEPYWPYRAKLWESLGKEDVARDITHVVWARSPLGSLRQDLLSMMENGADLKPLYRVLSQDLKPLEEYEVQFRGLVGGPPQIVVVTLKSNLEKANQCPLWRTGREVAIETPGSAEGKVYHKLS